MAFSVSTITSEGSGTSHTVAIPDGAATGKRVEVWFSSDGNPTVGLPLGWTRYFADLTVTDATLAVFYRDLDGTEGFDGTGDTITVTTSATERTSHAVYLIDGHDTGTAPEGAGTSGSSATPDPPSLNPTGWDIEEALWNCGAALRFAGAFTAAPANYTNLLNRQTAGGDAGATIGSARRILSAASENPGTFTQNGGSMLWVAATTAHRPAAGGGSTDLVVADATHAHTADAPALTQAHQLVVADAAHGQAADALALTQSHVLAVADATQAHTADAPTLTQANDLAVDDAEHGHTADSPTLTQVHSLAVADAAHAHAADTPTLAQVHQLVPADAVHGHLADNVTLAGGPILVVQDATHAHAVDSPALAQVHSLAVQDAAHEQQASAPTLAQVHNLVVADATHAHTTDAVVLFVGETVTPANRTLVVDDEQRVEVIAADPRATGLAPDTRTLVTT